MEYNDNLRYSKEHPALTAAKLTLEVAQCRFNHATGKREVDAACYELSAAKERVMMVIEEARASA